MSGEGKPETGRLYHGMYVCSNARDNIMKSEGGKFE